MKQPTILEPLRRNPRRLESLTFRAYAVVMALSLLGLLQASWRDAKVRLLGILVLYWLAGAAVTFGQDRYRVPIMPIFCVFAGCGAQTVWRLARGLRIGAAQLRHHRTAASPKGELFAFCGREKKGGCALEAQPPFPFHLLRA